MNKQVKIELVVDDKGNVVVKKFGKETEKAFGKVKKSAETTQKTLKTLATAAIGFFAVTKIKAAVTEWVKLAGVQQKSTAGMTQAMKSMGRYTPELHANLIDVAKGLQEITTFGDEATIEGQKFLLTYKNIGDDILPRASEAMLDLAALMGGDTKQAANMLGKASMGLVGELRRVGITIDDDIGKSGDFAAILGEIEKQVGGQARALAETGYGGLEQFANLWDDTKEDLGELVLVIIRDLLPALKSWAGALKDIAKYWKEAITPPDSTERLLEDRILFTHELELAQDRLVRLQERLSEMQEIGADYHVKRLKEEIEQTKRVIATREAYLKTIAQSLIRGKVGGKTPPGTTPGPEGGGITDTDIEIKDMTRLYDAAVKHSAMMGELAMMDQEWKEEAWAAEDETRAVRLEQQLADIDILYNAEVENANLMGELAMMEMEWEEAKYEKIKELEDKTVALKTKAAQSQYQVAVALGTAMLQYAGVNSKTIFAITKSLEVGQATAAAFAASNLALANPPGPPTTIPLAAAVLKAGLWNAAAIAALGMVQIAAPPGGGAVPTGTYPASPYTGYPVSYAGAAAEEKGKINIYVQGDILGEPEVVARLAEIISDGVENYEINLIATKLRE